MGVDGCFFFSSRRRHTRCALVTGVQTCALPIFGEAGHFPSVVRASSEWFPQKERSYAIGWVNSATTIGVILTAPTVALFMRVLGFDWRETFIYTGAFGSLLLILWLWPSSNPPESGKVSEAEPARIAHDPPKKVDSRGWANIDTNP